MATRSPRNLWLLALALVALGSGGCASGQLVDPPSTFKDLRPQTYEFNVVWEVAIEGMNALEYRVKTIDKDSDTKTAVITSNMKLEKPVLFEGEEYGSRLRVEIANVGPANKHSFRVAASRWLRFVSKGSGPGPWKPAGTAPKLHDQYQAALEDRFSKRYASPD